MDIAATENEGENPVETLRKKAPKHKKPRHILGKPHWPLYSTLIQQNFKLREINQRMKNKIKYMRERIQGGPTSLDFLAQVAGISH
jgi:hypothetical protein